MFQNLVFFTPEYLRFLREWSGHIDTIGFAIVPLFGIAYFLLVTGHLSLSEGKSDDIGCPDNRVWKILSIFGGPTGLTFGLPYYWGMNFLGLTGWFREYWTGFIYVQFVTSTIQLIVFLSYALFGPRSEKKWRYFKGHLKGCGWVSASSPVGWPLYVVQQVVIVLFQDNEVAEAICWIPRDVETVLVYLFLIIGSPLVVICIFASILNRRVIFPVVTWINQPHKHLIEAA